MFRRRSRAPVDEFDWASVPAVRNLRTTLLVVATNYGFALVLAGRDRTPLGGWRELMRWRMELMQRLAAQAQEFDEGPDTSRWGALGVGEQQMLDAMGELDRGDRAFRPVSGESLRPDMQEMLERLVLSARAVENLGVEPLDDIFPGEWPAGSALLGATEDSLVLMADEDDSSAPLAAGLAEMHDRIVATREEGVWGYLIPGSMRPALPRQSIAVSRKRQRGAIEARDQLVMTWSATLAFYRELEPDGRELAADMQAAVRQHLRNGAVTLRHVDQHRSAMDSMHACRMKHMDVRSPIATLRSMQRSLVLSVSEDPARRRQAMSLPEMERLCVPVHYQWRPG